MTLHLRRGSIVLFGDPKALAATSVAGSGPERGSRRAQPLAQNDHSHLALNLHRPVELLAGLFRRAGLDPRRLLQDHWLRGDGRRESDAHRRALRVLGVSAPLWASFRRPAPTQSLKGQRGRSLGQPRALWLAYPEATRTERISH